MLSARRTAAGFVRDQAAGAVPDQIGPARPPESTAHLIPVFRPEILEQRPLLSIDANYDGTGDIWLALR